MAAIQMGFERRICKFIKVSVLSIESICRKMDANKIYFLRRQKMTVKHDEIPYYKWLYAYEIVMPDPQDYWSYRYILHRFMNKIERGYWLKKTNQKPFDSPRLANKRGNKICYWMPMVRAARGCHYWPVTLIRNPDDTFRIFKSASPYDPGLIKS